MSSDRWDAIGQAATCSLFAGGAELAGQAAIISALTGQVWGVVGGAAGLLAATALSEFNGCNGPPNPNKPDNTDVWAGGCRKVNGCMVINQIKDGLENQYVQNVREWIGTFPDGEYPNGEKRYKNKWIDCDGNPQEDDEGGGYAYKGIPNVGSTCESDDPPPYHPGNPLGQPVTAPDPTGGPCTYTTTAIDAYINQSGGMSIQYRTCASGPAGCSGCTTFWFHGPGNVDPAPPTPIPGPDNEPLPPIPPTGPFDQPILDDIKECACEPPEPQELDFPVDLPSWSEEFKAVCNLDPQGNPEEVTFTSASADKVSSALIAIANNQQLLIKVMQQALDWKTPICSPTPTPVTGHLVSIHFESLENSPNSERSLRKLFRYRSQSSRTLAEIASYWKGFQWQAGPFCVGHTDAAWGTVQVWAQSVAEGQRVIRKAGTEAGIDPDTSGEWRTGSSDDPRYGMPGTMRIQRLEDGDWITSRRGPNGLPLYTVDP